MTDTERRTIHYSPELEEARLILVEIPEKDLNDYLDLIVSRDGGKSYPGVTERLNLSVQSARKSILSDVYFDNEIEKLKNRTGEPTISDLMRLWKTIKKVWVEI